MKKIIFSGNYLVGGRNDLPLNSDKNDCRNIPQQTSQPCSNSVQFDKQHARPEGWTFLIKRKRVRPTKKKKKRNQDTIYGRGKISGQQREHSLEELVILFTEQIPSVQVRIRKLVLPSSISLSLFSSTLSPEVNCKFKVSHDFHASRLPSNLSLDDEVFNWVSSLPVAQLQNR